MNEKVDAMNNNHHMAVLSRILELLIVLYTAHCLTFAHFYLPRIDNVYKNSPESAENGQGDDESNQRDGVAGNVDANDGLPHLKETEQ